MFELIRNRMRERGLQTVLIGAYRVILERIGITRLLMVVGSIDDVVTIFRKIQLGLLKSRKATLRMVLKS